VIAWNVITFALMGIDKSKAVKKRQRISESALLLCALLLGAFGSTVGMFFFHHKTRKAKFRIGMPLCLIVNIVILYYFSSILL